VPTIDAGQGFPETADLVSIVPQQANPYGDDHGPFVVARSTKSCDPNLLGYITDTDNGADGIRASDQYLPLAIYGYFPAKVTMENGPIRRGDPITSSSTPGAGMKATGACRTIGYALDEADADGTIQVFANTGESTLGEVVTLRQEIEGLKAELQQAITRQPVSYRVETIAPANSFPQDELVAVKQENTTLRTEVGALREQSLAQQNEISVLRQENAALDARLTALEQGSAAPGRMAALPTNGVWLLAVVAVGAIGLAYIRRRSAK
jgi:hypothetical protein